MRPCTFCGAENPEDVRICRACGKALDRTEVAAPALLGSMGGKRYTGLSDGAKGKPVSAPETAASEEPAAVRGTGLAGSMGGVRYGARPKEEPAPDAPAAEKKKGPDRGVVISLALAALAVAASVLLVFWDAIFGSAELVSRGIGGYINYYRPVQEEEILEEDGVSYVGDQMVIVSAVDATYEDMESFFTQRDMEIVGYVELIDTYQVLLSQSYTLSELHDMARELERDRHVDSATINAVRENSNFAIPSDPWDGKSNWNAASPNSGNWGVVAIHAPESWERWEPAEVRVGVVDSMFDENHVDLHFAMTKDNEIFESYPDDDDKYHGTHVSGTIGAIHDNGLCVAGVAENCQIYGYSAIRYEGTIDEVSAMAELAAQDVRVINYSMGLIPEIRDEAIDRNGMERDIYYRYAARFSQTALQHLLKKGYDFVLVCAAGNDPVDALWASEYAYITDPAIKNRILVVGAAGVDENGTYFQVSWSARGDRVDVMAPGLEILSTYPGGSCYMSGTSMATPHVTGVCASVWAIAPELSGADVKRIVVRTATTPVAGSSAGMVNMEAAMAAAEEAAR